MKSKRMVIPASLICLVLLVSFQTTCGEKPDRDAAKPEGAVAKPAQEPEANPLEEIVRLTESQMREFEIESRQAAPGTIRMELSLPGEVVLNADRIAHVVPRVPGVVREVRKNLGERAMRGEVMAVLESRELADFTAALMAAHERLELAKSNFAREELVWRKKISPEQDYYEAKSKLAEASIELRTAEQKLRALGFPNEYIAQLPGLRDEETTLYHIKAPFNGTVMEKHITLGELVKDDAAAFVIADLSTVWVNLDVQQKDLLLLKLGQTASISVGDDPQMAAEGYLRFIEPTATETNRTIHARVVVPNPSGRLRPGLFVSGRIRIGEVRIPVLVPNDALVLVEGSTCVFVKEGDGFRLQQVTTGRADISGTEITRGLEPGKVYVAKGAFTLKSEIQKPEAEE